MDLGEGQQRSTIDKDTREFPADPPAVGLAGAIASDAVTDALEATQVLDIRMDQFSGMLALNAPKPARQAQGP